MLLLTLISQHLLPLLIPSSPIAPSSPLPREGGRRRTRCRRHILHPSSLGGGCCWWRRRTAALAAATTNQPDGLGLTEQEDGRKSMRRRAKEGRRGRGERSKEGRGGHCSGHRGEEKADDLKSKAIGCTRSRCFEHVWFAPGVSPLPWARQSLQRLGGGAARAVKWPPSLDCCEGLPTAAQSAGPACCVAWLAASGGPRR